MAKRSPEAHIAPRAQPARDLVLQKARETRRTEAVAAERRAGKPLGISDVICREYSTKLRNWKAQKG
jgi:hypothetical protein